MQQLTNSARFTVLRMADFDPEEAEKLKAATAAAAAKKKALEEAGEEELGEEDSEEDDEDAMSDDDIFEEEEDFNETMKIEGVLIGEEWLTS